MHLSGDSHVCNGGLVFLIPIMRTYFTNYFCLFSSSFDSLHAEGRGIRLSVGMVRGINEECELRPQIKCSRAQDGEHHRSQQASVMFSILLLDDVQLCISHIHQDFICYFAAVVLTKRVGDMRIQITLV